MKNLFIILFILFNTNNVYADEFDIKPEIDKIKFYLYKSMFNSKYIYEVRDIHAYIYKKTNPQTTFYQGNYTFSSDLTVITYPDLLFGYGVEWYTQYDSPTCELVDLKTNKLKKCLIVRYIIDKPLDEQKAYFKIIHLNLSYDKGKLKSDSKVILQEEFYGY